MSAAVGSVNGYLCESCGRVTMTVHRDEGVTPFLLACRVTPGCQGMARSGFYRPVPDRLRGPITHEWYRPGKRERRTLTPGVRGHVDAGGLLIRSLSGDTCVCSAPALLGHFESCGGGS